jgi:hypothetical protein
MPQRDTIHEIVRRALVQDGWDITDDPYAISYGERFLFVDLGATEVGISEWQGGLIGARREGYRIAIEIKEFRGRSIIADLEQAIGQYMLYRLLLNQVDPDRILYLAIMDFNFDTIFCEPIGELVRTKLPIKLLIINSETIEVKQWIP